MERPFQLDVSVPAGTDIRQAMVLQSGLSADALDEAASKGAVWISHLNGRKFGKRRRIRLLDTQPAADALVNLNYNEAVLSQKPSAFHCVHQQVNYGIWHKPSGMLCQGSKWSDHTTATEVAARQMDKSCFLVHRLDKAAQGLLLLAYTKNATRKLTRLFEQRQIEKTYYAWVAGRFNSALPLHINTAIDDNQALTIIEKARWHAQSACTQLTISIETGRKHQIRKHLAELGYPVLGDRLYGNESNHSVDVPIDVSIDLQLMASRLQFTCPFTASPVDVCLTAAQLPEPISI